MACLAVAMLSGCGGSGGSAGQASAPTEYTALSAPTAVAITGYSGDAMEPFISKDGRYLFFNNRNDPSVDTNLYYASRVDDETFAFLGPLPGANSASLDGVASLDALGNFYLISTRSYATSLSTVYSGSFSSSGLTNVGLVPGVSAPKAGIVTFDAEISADGRSLWFDDGDYSSGSLGATSISMATRQGTTFVRDTSAAAMLAEVNTPELNYAPSISADGLELFFTRLATSAGATPAIYRTTRPNTSAPFATPQLVAGAGGFVEAPSLSADGRLLYFHKLVNGTFVIHHVRR